MSYSPGSQGSQEDGSPPKLGFTGIADEETRRSRAEALEKAKAEARQNYESSSPSMGAGSTQLNSTTFGRESRAQEAIRMKDEQLRILQEQNTHLLQSLDRVEEEANRIQMEKLAVEEENRTLRDQNFELQAKSRADQAALKRIQAEMVDKDKQLKILTDQNAELLRLLETEEAQTTALENENRAFRDELEALRAKYNNLLAAAKTHEELAAQAAREGQLRAEELRLLRAETDQLRSQNQEIKRKTQVELEALQEQLRVRKEKQYHLLGKTQEAEEGQRAAKDQLGIMEEKIRTLHAKTVELETQLQVEARAKRNQQETNKRLLASEANLRSQNQELQEKIEKIESERLRMESEARDASEQLREMAEKVFQLLERLKLAELGKSKAVEALRLKEQEVTALKKKNSRLLKESTKEGKARVQAELDKKVLAEQVDSLKQHNSQLAQRSKEEVKSRLKEHEERKAAQEKVRTLSSRLTFLLNKLQADEEAKVVQREEIKKMEAQLKAMKERNEELTGKLNSTAESNRIVTQALRLKQEELETLGLKHDALVKQLEEGGFNGNESYGGSMGPGGSTAMGNSMSQTMSTIGSPEAGSSNQTSEKRIEEVEPGSEQVRLAGGKGRFYVEAKPTQGLLLIRGARASAKRLLDRLDVNGFLKKAQKSVHFKERIIEKMSHLLGLLLVEEEDGKNNAEVHLQRAEQVQHMQRKLDSLQQRFHGEEEAKRRTLLRYVHAVKTAAEAAASAAAAGAAGIPGFGDANGPGGILQLPESGIGDEEVHALAALLRENGSITELNLRGNSISDEGARALGAVLSGPSRIRTIDLRENFISKNGVKAIAEGLERSDRVRHVYVHAGGKVEALGTGLWAAPRGGAADSSAGAGMMAVETVCAVDIRNNKTPPDPMETYKQEMDALRTNLQVEHGVSMEESSMPNGSLMAESMASSGPKGGKMTKRQMEFERKAEAERQKRAAREAKRQQKNDKKRAQEAKLEMGWNGRKGGIDIEGVAAGETAIKPMDHTAYARTASRPTTGEGATKSTGSLPPLDPQGSGKAQRSRIREQRSTGMKRAGTAPDSVREGGSQSSSKIDASPLAQPLRKTVK